MRDRFGKLMLPGVVFATCVWINGLGVAFAQTLDITPHRVLVDEVAVIRATGLTPGEHVSIQAELLDGGGKRWSSQAEFVADAQGIVDASKQAPAIGSYDEVSAMGLIWSMRPEEKHVAAYQNPSELGVQLITFHLLRNDQQVASAQLQQLSVADGVQGIKIEGAIHGVLFLPNTHERRPGVLVVGGSEGGLRQRRAAWLASRGYAALALAYFHYDHLPSQLENIPLEYFQQALAWMRQRPEINPDRLAVMGGSRGGELALQLGSMFTPIKAVVAFSPSNVRVGSCCRDSRWPAWTWGGQPLAFISAMTMQLNPSASAQATIAVENTQGPILLISGEDDGVWPSTAMANATISRLKQAHFPYDYEHLKYPHAGHWAGRPEITPAWHGNLGSPIAGRSMHPGGKPEGNAASSIDAIPKVLEFLRKALQ
jgi:dienelactone hydrolase